MAPVCARSGRRRYADDSSAEPAAMVLRDQRGLPTDLELLDRPGIPVGVAEAEERAAIAFVEHHDLAAVDASVDELLPSRFGVGDDELEAAHRAGRHLALRRPGRRTRSSNPTHAA